MSRRGQPRVTLGASLRVLRLAAAGIALLLQGQPGAAAPAATMRAPEDLAAREHGPVDWGFGPGVRPDSLHGKLRSLADAVIGPADEVPAQADAHIKGAWGAPLSWPIVAIHAVLLPDGRVLTYGTDESGQQNGALVYDLWDPGLGTGTESHWLLPNITATDIFCAAQTVLPASGDVAIFGGDATHAGKRNYSNNRLTLFQAKGNSVVDAAPMAYARWYPTSLVLPGGRILLLGGRRSPSQAATTPELLSSAGVWSQLPGATSTAAFSTSTNWWYPRAFVNRRNLVIIVGNDGRLFQMSVTGKGAVSTLSPRVAVANERLPILMYAPGKLLAVRDANKAYIIDIDTTPVTTRTTAAFPGGASWANLTVLPDGRVLAVGGSTRSQVLDTADYGARLWTPATGVWTLGAAAQKARLYHSTALLLPDATVLVAGGGAPGPVTNLNAEIYYPPYLFRTDGSGELAARPDIVAAPTAIGTAPAFELTVGTGQRIGRVVAIRTGSVTHSFNPDQRFLELAFTQSDTVLRVTAPTDRKIAIPGYYLLFVIDADGVPSVAKIVQMPIAA